MVDFKALAEKLREEREEKAEAALQVAPPPPPKAPSSPFGTLTLSDEQRTAVVAVMAAGEQVDLSELTREEQERIREALEPTKFSTEPWVEEEKKPAPASAPRAVVLDAEIAAFPPADEDLSEDAISEPDPEALVSRYGYLTGPAGSGKTYLVVEKERLAPGRIQLCATTGIAAVNLGTSTINSLIGYYDTRSLMDKWTEGRLTGRLLKLHTETGLRRIVLDETSMLDGDQLAIFCSVIDEVNAHLGIGAEDPVDVVQEAGLSLTLTGDFMQLAPVKAKFAFEVGDWRRFEKATTTLSKIRRQADLGFIEALQAVRRGDGDSAAVFLQSQGCFVEQLEQGFPGSTIMAKNEQVDRYNDLQHRKLPGEAARFAAERWGTQSSEWVKQIPDVLELREGALVMVLANNKYPYPSRAYRYVNGDLGVFRGRTDGGHAIVELRRTKQTQTVEVVTRSTWHVLEGGRRAELKKEHGELWEQYVSKDGKRELIGEVSYMPLRLAWATTVHRSQGLSLDQVQVNIRDWMFKQCGMVYVALSRARSAAGLRIVGSPRTLVEKATVDPRVRRWV